MIPFAIAFGLLFLGVGTGRLMEAFKGPRKVESAFWGIVGILIGLGFFAGVVWLFLSSKVH